MQCRLAMYYIFGELFLPSYESGLYHFFLHEVLYLFVDMLHQSEDLAGSVKKNRHPALAGTSCSCHHADMCCMNFSG